MNRAYPASFGLSLSADSHGELLSGNPHIDLLSPCILSYRILSFLQRVTRAELEALRTTVLIATLSKRLAKPDLDLSVGGITFPSFTSTAQYSALENLIVIIPKEFLMLSGATESISPIPTRLPSPGLLSWSILRELLTSLYSVLPILEILVYKLPRLIWTPELNEMRARLLPSQRTIGDIPPGQNLLKLCDDADKVFLEMDPRKSWLKLFDERSVRDNLAELSRLTASPRAPLPWELLEYPSYTVPSSTIAQFSTRLAQEVSKLALSGAESNSSIRQSIYDVATDAHQHICTTFNMIVVKMANARQDAWTWSENRTRMEKEAELALDYERMLNAKLVAERFQSEMNHLKVLTRRHQQFFTEGLARLLPTDLAVLYRKEYHAALTDRLAGRASSSSSSSSLSPSSSSSSSTSPIASPAASAASPQPSSSSTSIDAAMYKSRVESAQSKRISELEDERTELRRMNAKLTNDNALLKSKVACVSVAEMSGSAMLEELRRELAELQASYAAELNRASALSDSISEQFVQKAEMQVSAKRAEERALTFAAELEQSRAERTRLEGDLKTTKARASDAELAVQSHVGVIGDQQRQLDLAISEMSRLQEDLKKTEAHLKMMEADLSQREADLQEKEKVMRAKEEELSLKEAQNLQLSDEIESLRNERQQSSTDALFARRLNAESGEDPLRAELGGRSKEELISLFMNHWTKFQEAEQRATHSAQALQRVQSQLESFLRQQSLRHSND